MHMEECLCCDKMYDTRTSSSSRPMIYCSDRCEIDRARELALEIPESVDAQDEFYL